MRLSVFAVFVAVGLAFAQGVTNKVPPPGDAPAGCEASTDGNFEISILPLNSPAARALAVKKRGTCHGEGTLVLALSDTVLTDSLGRTGYIASNYQFQFDNPPQAGALYTAGFTRCANHTLAFGNSTVFYQCRSGTFYNLYDRWWAKQCEPVEIVVIPCGGEGGKASESQAVIETVVGTQVVTTTVVIPLVDGQPQVVTTTMVVYICQIGDGQIQWRTTPCTASPATITLPPASQHSDGQVQVPPVSQASDGQVQVPPLPPVSQGPDGQVQVTPAPASVPPTTASVPGAQEMAPTAATVATTTGPAVLPTGAPGASAAPSRIKDQVDDLVFLALGLVAAVWVWW
ncbi:hypothetical protein VTI74DRAFT_10671 [Chaetomium olivicolor]